MEKENLKRLIDFILLHYIPLGSVVTYNPDAYDADNPGGNRPPHPMRAVQDQPPFMVCFEIELYRSLIDDPPDWAKKDPETHKRVLRVAEKAFLSRFPVLVVATVRVALKANNTQVVDEFFLNILRLSNEQFRLARIEALWRIVELTRRWLAIDQKNLLGYLNKSVYLKSKSLSSKSDISPTEGYPDQPDVAEKIRTLDPDPLEQLISKEHRKLVNKILDILHETGSSRDRKLISLLKQGLTPTDAIRKLKTTWSAWQALQQRADRLARKHSLTLN